MMKRSSLIAALLCFSAAGISLAEEKINENDLFSGADAVSEQAAATVAEASTEKKTVGFSGELTSAMIDVESSTAARNSLYSYTVGNLFLDVRMPQSVKAFANLEMTYLSTTKKTDAVLRETFLDFNAYHKAYFRAGKQVLQWGRCTLWNPTDLINIERKLFIRKLGYREGAYGMKVHIPFGTDYNVYGFLDTGNAPSREDVGAALKFEFLVGKTEMAFSGWAKNSYDPVLGYDFSSRIGTVDVAGEAAISQGDNMNRLKKENGQLSFSRKTNEWTPRASVNFRKGFRVGNFKDRLSVTSEFYYNQAGTTEDLFEDPASRDFMNANGLYEMNNVSRFYGALFTSLSRFILSDITLNVNYIQNFSDGSGILSAGAVYRTIHDFSIGILLNAPVGREDREYTHGKEKHDAQLTFGIAF